MLVYQRVPSNQVNMASPQIRYFSMEVLRGKSSVGEFSNVMFDYLRVKGVVRLYILPKSTKYLGDCHHPIRESHPPISTSKSGMTGY